MKIEKQKILSILKNITEYANQNTCIHEDTHRGGVIWEICDSCGMKWADDEGGKPEDAHDIPNEISEAEDLIFLIENG